MRETRAFDSRGYKKPERFDGGDLAEYMEYSRDLSRISDEAHSSGRLGPKVLGDEYSLARQTWQRVDRLKDEDKRCESINLIY